MPDDGLKFTVHTTTGTTANNNTGTNASSSDWIIDGNFDIDDVIKNIGAPNKKIKQKIGKKSEKKSDGKMLYSCDSCSASFRATKKEVNARENGGYYCSLKCKISGKYHRSSLDKSLFELEEEIEEKMFPLNKIPAFCIGDWVEVNESCLIGQYIGKIIQIVDIDEPTDDYRRFEYTCQFTETHDQIFWEHELTLSKVIPINGVFMNSIKGKKDVKNSEEKPEEKEEEKPKVIWV